MARELTRAGRVCLPGKSALSRVTRFKTAAFHSDFAGIISGLRYHEQTSLVMQMLQSLFEGMVVPEDAKLLLATTKGEIDLLEQSMLEQQGRCCGCSREPAASARWPA